VIRPITRGEVLIEGGQTNVPFFVLKATVLREHYSGRAVSNSEEICLPIFPDNPGARTTLYCNGDAFHDDFVGRSRRGGRCSCPARLVNQSEEFVHRQDFMPERWVRNIDGCAMGFIGELSDGIL